jgi:hypothetical protein
MGVRWPPLTRGTRAPARLANDSCKATGITWSNVPMSDHDGIVIHAGGSKASAVACRPHS